MDEDNDSKIEVNKDNANQRSNENITPKLIEDEMKQSYLDYAMSVIVGRALPDVRDGLKPVHRRILYSMYDMGMLHNKPYKKSARIVGDCLGKYHPHGDMAVYDALVRMVQDFSLRYPLIEGQGNFGSIDGDNAAAMRYSEARLNKFSEEMLEDLDKETIDFQPNFDNSLKEPSVLPSKAPNLLLNGSSGIAVGMATNIPPHNMGEIINGIIATIDLPEITILELLKYIKGPDFPTGGIICGASGIKNAYETGRGRLVVRARSTVEDKKITIHEIPYMVNKAEMIIQMAALVREKKIDGISDIRDESDREGISVIIELKKDAHSEIVLNQLYKHTRLQTTFGVNMLALVDNQPKTLNLKQLITYYIKHRQSVVRKRTQFELNKASDRAHVLEGLIIALTNLDNTIEMIRKSTSIESARTTLITSLSLTKIQANAILEMKLSGLTSLEQDKVKLEHNNLLVKIEEFKSILSDENKILSIIKQELITLKEKYGDERRTLIDGAEIAELDVEDLIKHEGMVVTITHSGYIKRLALTSYKQQKRGGKGVIAAGTKDEDFVEDIFIADTLSYLLFFTNKGKVHWIKVYELPEAGRQAKGKAIINLLQLEEGEKISAFIPVEKFDDQYYLMMATKDGTVKKTILSSYSNPRRGGIIAITLDEGDELIGVVLTDGKQQIMLATKHGMAVRFEEAKVRATGRSARGVRGAKLHEADKVIGIVVCSDDKALLTITENGYGKRTLVSEYRLTNRGGIGVKNIICSDRNGNVVSVKSVEDNDQLMFISRSGNVIRTDAKGISIIGRSTQGMRLMKLDENDKVVAAAKIISEKEEEEVAKVSPTMFDEKDSKDDDTGSDGTESLDSE